MISYLPAKFISCNFECAGYAKGYIPEERGGEGGFGEFCVWFGMGVLEIEVLAYA
jgi:hypothetical protein